MLNQCFICGHFKFGINLNGYHACNECYKNGGELVITSEYSEGMGVMEAVYLEIQCNQRASPSSGS